METCVIFFFLSKLIILRLLLVNITIYKALIKITENFPNPNVSSYFYHQNIIDSYASSKEYPASPKTCPSTGKFLKKFEDFLHSYSTLQKEHGSNLHNVMF